MVNEVSLESLPSALREFSPSVGIVLGSGLGSFVDTLSIVERIPYEDIDALPSSQVEGHAGQFVLAKMGEQSLLIAQGRVHLYEGYHAHAVSAGVRVMAAAGIKQLIITNAAGSINEKYPPGQWMRISDHINLTGTSSLIGGAHFVDMSEAYSEKMGDRFKQAASQLSAPLHEGVYAGLLGPQYETPAEIRMLKAMGADAVGMSTVLEVIQARALDLEVGGFSCLTNWAAGMGQESLSHQEVIEVGQSAAAEFVEILQKALL